MDKQTIKKTLSVLTLCCCCCLGGAIVGRLLPVSDKNGSKVSIQYFQHTKASCDEFNLLVEEYLRSMDVEHIQCYAVPRKNGVALVVVGQDGNKKISHENAMRMMINYYMGYMSSANKTIPVKASSRLEWVEFR